MRDDNYVAPADAGLVPIRDISRLTGVNTVTLRAWERRYGLIKPQRTHKGHRLYSQHDIARVKEIQTWLARGLAIGKVNALLNNPQNSIEPEAFDSVWLQLEQDFLAAVAEFSRPKLERLFEEVLAVYPAEMIADGLLVSLLERLYGDEQSEPSQRAFLTSVLLEHIYRVQYRQRQTAKGEGILVLSSSVRDTTLLPLIFNYSLLVNHYRAEFMDFLSLSEVLQSIAFLDAKLAVIVGYKSLDISLVKVYLNSWRQRSSCPLLLVGHLAKAYLASLGDDERLQLINTVRISNEVGSGGSPIYACETQQQALSLIHQLFSSETFISEPRNA